MAKIDMAAQIAKAAKDRERRDRLLLDTTRDAPAAPAPAPTPEVPMPAEDGADRFSRQIEDKRRAAVERGEVPDDGLWLYAPPKKPADAVVVEPVPPKRAEPEPVATDADVAEPVDDIPAPAPQAPKGRKKPQPSRQETVPITVHFPRTVRQQLRLVAAETDRQLQDVIAEGLNMVLRKHGKPAIAPRDPKR